jgi:hypothetical protein
VKDFSTLIGRQALATDFQFLPCATLPSAAATASIGSDSMDLEYQYIVWVGARRVEKYQMELPQESNNGWAK